MKSLYKFLSVLVLILLFMGCSSTAREHYDMAREIVKQSEKPTEEQMREALANLDHTIEKAKDELRDAYKRNHDQTAYLIPLARVAKASLYARFNQLTPQENESWAAIREAEQYIGKHIRKELAQEQLFISLGVYFRREKIRRHVFSALQESYRREGNKDLQELMNAQARWSDEYLRCRTAMIEEQNIRKVENIELWQDDEKATSTIVFVTKNFANSLTYGMNEASLDIEYSELEMQAKIKFENDPQGFNDYMAQLKQKKDELSEKNEQQFQEQQKQIREEHERNLQKIEKIAKRTTAQALVETIQLIQVSDEVKQLQEYQVLKQQVKQLEDYIKRKGYDAQSAAFATKVRGTLDALVMKLQKIAQQKRTA